MAYYCLSPQSNCQAFFFFFLIPSARCSRSRWRKGRCSAGAGHRTTAAAAARPQPPPAPHTTRRRSECGGRGGGRAVAAAPKFGQQGPPGRRRRGRPRPAAWGRGRGARLGLPAAGAPRLSPPPPPRAPEAREPPPAPRAYLSLDFHTPLWSLCPFWICSGLTLSTCFFRFSPFFSLL